MQHSNRKCAVEMSYIRGACGVSGWDGESNESVYERYGMGVTVKGMVEWAKRVMLRWFGNMMRIWENGFMKKVYDGRIEEGGVRGRPPVKWISRVSEYWSKRVGSSRIECAERGYQIRERWRHFCRSHPLEGSSCEGAGHQRYR